MHCQFGSQHSTGFWESPLELVPEMSLYSKSKYFHHEQYVGNRITLVVGHLLEAAQQVQLEGVGAGPVIHLHQFADLVILVGDLLCPIVIDFLHQIKGSVGILGHIAVRIGLGDQIAVAVVDINGAVAKRVDLLRDQIPTIVLIQRDLVRVHAIESIHTVEVGGNELVILIVGKYGLRAQRIDGLYNISIAVIDILGGIKILAAKTSNSLWKYTL